MNKKVESYVTLLQNLNLEQKLSKKLTKFSALDLVTLAVAIFSLQWRSSSIPLRRSNYFFRQPIHELWHLLKYPKLELALVPLGSLSRITTRLSQITVHITQTHTHTHTRINFNYSKHISETSLEFFKLRFVGINLIYFWNVLKNHCHMALPKVISINDILRRQIFGGIEII